MKKSVKVLIGIILVLSLGAAGTFGYLYFSKDKPNDDAQNSDKATNAESVKFDVGSYVASVDGVSIIADDTGVRVFNEADRSQKKIFDRPAECAMFDGETAYFIEKDIEDSEVKLYDWDGTPLSQEEYGPWLRGRIYSYNTKTGELQEIIRTNAIERTNFVDLDETGFYYTDTKEDEVGYYYPKATSAFCKYDKSTQKTKVILKDIGWYSVENGKLFYQTEASTGTGEDGYHSLYVYDFKSDSSKMISKEDADFLKYEGDEVFFTERICTFAENDEYIEYDDVKFTLKSFNLKTNELKVVAELDFLPDEPKIWVSYEDSNNLLVQGKEYDPVLYSLQDKSYKVVDEEPDKDGYFITSGSREFFIETLYSFDNEVQAEMPSGVAINLYDGKNYKLLKEFDDEYLDVAQITENGAYIYSSRYDEDKQAFTPVEIEFLPLDIK